MKHEILITNTLEVKTTLELSGRGLRKICTDLAGRNVYAATDAALARLRKQHSCLYENDNGALVTAR